MGLSDRDYSREGSWTPSNPWSQTNSTMSMTVMIIIANVAVFFLELLLIGNTPNQSVLTNWFEVLPDTILKPWNWYQFITYGFLHSLADKLHITFNMLGLFFFGGAVERMIGRSEFLRFYLVAIVVGGVVFSLRCTTFALIQGVAPATYAGGTIGASGAVMAATILFAFLEPHATIYLMMVLPVKAWLVAILFVGMNLFGMIGAHDDHIAYDVHLAGAAFAAVYFKRRWKLARWDFVHWVSLLKQWTRRGPRLRLHDPERKLAQEEAAADRILDKIQAHGMDSLTKAERRTLEKHSRRKRESRRT